MSVSLGNNVIQVAGACGVEEAETLLALIQAHPGMLVNISEADGVHTALWQVIISLRPRITGVPKDAFIRDWIMPMLAAPSD